MMEKRLTRLTTIVLMAALMLAIFIMPSEEAFAASRSSAKPKITKATVYDTNNVKLTWSKAKGAVKYRVYRKKGSGKYRLVKTTTKRTYYSKNLAYGAKYTYKVKAVTAKGKTATSMKKMAYTKPAKPTITKATVYNTNNVKLTWSKAKGAVKYKVYRKKGENGRYVLVKSTTKKTYYSKSLAYGTKYTYKVKAVSAKGKTTSSKIKRAYTNPAKPVLKAELSDFTTVKLTWNKTKGAVAYKVYYKRGSGEYGLLSGTGKDETEYEVYQGIGTTYTYKIKAVSANGKTNTSTAKTVTTHTHDWEAVYTEEDQGHWEYIDMWKCGCGEPVAYDDAVTHGYNHGINGEEYSFKSYRVYTGNWISNWQTVVDYYKCSICGETSGYYADCE